MSSEDLLEQGQAIAIIGMAARFPGAESVDEYWKNLRDGVETISFFSDQELEDAGIAPSLIHRPNYVKAAAILKDIELFDASFFGYTPREAEIMDPQQRLFLECAWNALESAGYDAEKYAGAIGIYAGVGINTYWINLFSNPRVANSLGLFQLGIVNDKDHLSTRVSYKLNLKGPSINVQTACSTSLVAVHLACQSLINGECDLALAGGVTVTVPQKAGYLYEEGGINSPDGHCRAFDARAQGTVGGSGVGIVAVKRLAEALADGDQIYALIKGSAVNNDGAMKVGYTAPSVEGQAKAVAEALAISGVEPGTISYIETHGTGTPLGDPIEMAALTEVFRAHTDRQGFCAIGSVKTNIGHLDAAAGVAGLIKTTLALNHQMLPPSLHFQQPNPKIDFHNSPFYVNAALQEWKRSDTPRRAAVSSFGIGGTNAHIVLEESPAAGPSGPSRPWQLVVLSAKTATALQNAAGNLAAYLRQKREVSLADVAYTCHLGRREFKHRRAILCRNQEEAIEVLENPQHHLANSGMSRAQKRPLAFLFAGQGSQRVGMAEELYRTEPTFRAEIDRCAELFRPDLGLDLRDVIYPRADERQLESEQRLTATWLAQPALFAVEYSMAQMWAAWGVKPRAMLGHSIGEYVAACLAGVFPLEVAISLVAARGRLMQRVDPGGMLAVTLAEKEVIELLAEPLALAAVNGPTNCVVSGPWREIDELEQLLNKQNVACRRLRASHAFHSSMVELIIDEFTELVRRIELQAPAIPYISNLTGTWITAQETTDPHYWAKHLRHTVRFGPGLAELMKQPDSVLLEIGPGQTLSLLAKRLQSEGQMTLSSLPHPREMAGTAEEGKELPHLLSALAKLWVAGIEIDWQGFYKGQRRRRMNLPTYPFERKRHWIEARSHKRASNVTDNGTVEETALEHIFIQQLHVMAQQLDVLSQRESAERW